MKDFSDLLRLFAAGGVEFHLVGGMAAVVHGSARVSEHLDVVYRRREMRVS